MNIIAKKLMGGGNILNYLLVAMIVLCGTQSVWAEDEIVDLGGKEVSKTASEFSDYKDKIIENGTIVMSEHISRANSGKYTIGNGATIKDATGGGPEFNGDWNFNVVDGGFYYQNVASGDHRFIMPMQYGDCTFTLDNGAFTTDADKSSNNAEPLTLGWIWAYNNDNGKNKDVSMNVVIRNESTLSVPNGNIRIGGTRKSANRKSNTLKVDFAVANSTMNIGKEIFVGCSHDVSNWLNYPENSYVRVMFGPNADITCKQVFANPNPSPSVTFDGATIHWIEGGNSFIGHNSSLGDIYTIESNGLTIDIPKDKSLTCDTNASSLKGEGGITKIGEGSITWNKVSTGGSAGMTFTGPLVVSKGTWVSTLGYAASAFKANGGNLTLSGALSASKIELAATDGGKLTLSGATVTDAKPNMTLASNGTTDFFTHDNAVGTHTLGTLTLGEEAVLDLTGGDIGVDTVSADSLVLLATAAKPVTVKFSNAANIIGGSYTILAISGSGEFSAEGLAKFKLDTNAPEGSALSISGNKLILTVPSKNPATWTGGANDGKFSSVGNWLGNKVPGANDEVVIKVDSETSLTCDVALNVKSITFHSLSAKVSIKGAGSIVIAESIANGSDARHVIDVPVEFKSADEYAPIDVTGEVDFQDGVKGTAPVNHTTFYGNYILTATSWTISSPITLSSRAQISAPNTTLKTKIANAVNMQDESRFILDIYDPQENGCIFGECSGLFKVNKIDLEKDKGIFNVDEKFKGVLDVGEIFYFGDNHTKDFVFSPNASAVIVFGKKVWSKRGAICYTPRDGVPLVLRSSSDWYFDIENNQYVNLANMSQKIVSGSLDIDTSHYGDNTVLPHTVSVKNTSSRSDNVLIGEGAMSAFGNGTFKFEKTAKFTGGFTASNGVTVAVNKDVYPGKGNVTIKDTATFSLVQANSGTVPVAGTLTMKGGTTLRIPEFVAGVLPLSVGALAFDGVTEESKVALNIESGALVEGYNAIIKAVTTLPENAWDNFNVNLNEIVPAGVMPLYVAQGDTLYIVVKGANDAIWTGAGADAKFSTGSNWMGGQIPANGSCVHIAAAGETTLVNDINGFSPSSITFPAGSSAITIDGEAITGVVAITNLSTTTSHTINVPVYFTGDIQVKQAAMAEEGDLTKAHITFAGGAHAAQGCAIENGNFTAVYSRCMFGDYYFYPTAENPWSALNQGSGKRNMLGPNSSLYLPYAKNTTGLYIGEESTVTASVVEVTATTSIGHRLCFRNYGELVITNEFVASGTGGKKDEYSAYGAGTGALSVYKIEKATCTRDDGWTFWFSDSNSASHGTYYFGKGGINFGSSKGFFGIGKDADNDEQTVRPWYGDFTIASGTGNTSSGYDIYMFRNVVFNTDDENGFGRTITLDARPRFDKTPTFTVSGSGKVLVSSIAKNAAEPPVTVVDTATLAFKPGAMLTKDSITVNEGATLEVAQSGVVSIEGTLSPVGGATLAFNFTDRKLAPVLEVAALDNENTDPNGIIWISISGLRPVGGLHVLTSGGVFGERQIKLLEERQPDWVKSVSCNANGEIVVDIKSIGTRIVVR